MTKSTRIALAVLVSLLVIVAIATTVQGATLSARQDRAGSHLVSGPKVDLNHYREAAPASSLQSPLPAGVPSHAGNGCESESHSSSED
jgi:hypothetical protein